jgi:SAM-dependent methyltransferase
VALWSIKIVALIRFKTTKVESLNVSLPREMMEHTYPLLYELEESHWWYVGRTHIIASFAKEICAGIADRTPRILDVGCGTGANLKMLSEFGDAEGVDISPDAIEFCRQRKLK